MAGPGQAAFRVFYFFVHVPILEKMELLENFSLVRLSSRKPGRGSSALPALRVSKCGLSQLIFQPPRARGPERRHGRYARWSAHRGRLDCSASPSRGRQARTPVSSILALGCQQVSSLFIVDRGVCAKQRKICLVGACLGEDMIVASQWLRKPTMAPPSTLSTPSTRK